MEHLHVLTEKWNSLKGCPEHITGDFYFMWCKSLRSLEDGPKVVNGDFNCNSCRNLASLENGQK